MAQLSHRGYFVRIARVPSGHGKDCSSDDYRDTTLQLLAEAPFGFLLPDAGFGRYEASGIAVDEARSVAYVAFDNSYTMARLHDPIRGGARFPFAHAMYWPSGQGESGFEFVTRNGSDGTFIVGREGVKGPDGVYRAETVDVVFTEDGVTEGTRCTTEMSFRKGNKGFEGGAVVADGTGGSFLLGLCEGNLCDGGKRGRRAGDGRIVVMRRVEDGARCVWRTVETLKLPRKAKFQDYAGMTIKDGRVAVVSQENSAVYVGSLEVNGGRVKFGDGMILDFPRGSGCAVEYCNVEGVAFWRGRALVTVSDAMKGDGRQGFECARKEQSVHLFRVPDKAARKLGWEA